ncbi:MAG: hypothetical protein HC831_02545 [Chloroflexia bacterium]|nr:hypothetical protein [Chloroflexia bacterium]
MDEILFLLRYYQFQRVYYAFDVLGDDKKLGLIKRKLYGIENLHFYKTSGKFEEMPPPPPPSKTLFSDSKLKGFNFYLKKDKLLLINDNLIEWVHFNDTLQTFLACIIHEISRS